VNLENCLKKIDDIYMTFIRNLLDIKLNIPQYQYSICWKKFQIFRDMFKILYFRNKYDKRCLMCNKNLNEDCEHIFITCERSKEFYEFVRHEYLHRKNK